MKTNHVLSLIVGLLLSSIANAQEMAKLYTYLINDYYNELCTKGDISEQNILYITCGFCDCQDKCFDYEIKLKNDRIQFVLPVVDEAHSETIFYRLSTPEFEQQLLVISVGIYNMIYRESDNQKFIYLGTVKYFFQYDKKKSEYVFKSKKEYGL